MKLNMKFDCFSHMQSYSARVSLTENICKKLSTVENVTKTKPIILRTHDIVI